MFLTILKLLFLSKMRDIFLLHTVELHGVIFLTYFFAECGAFDGEGLSNTLLFELKRNWTGLLVKSKPFKFNSIFIPISTK